MSSRSFDLNGKPRRRHKLKHGTSTKSMVSANTADPQSPFVSPLRFAKQKSLLRITSPKSTKSPSTTLSKRRIMLPGSLPLDSTTKSIPWDENDDEDYPEVPKTPQPQHAKLQGGGGDDNNNIIIGENDNNNYDSDGISSVSTGSVNGEIRIPNDDESDEEQPPWEYKQFNGTTTAATTTTSAHQAAASSSTPEPEPATRRGSMTKKVSKLLGKHKKRFMRKGGKKNKFSGASQERSTEFRSSLELNRSQQLLKDSQERSSQQELSSSMQLQQSHQSISSSLEPQQSQTEIPSQSSLQQQQQQTEPLSQPPPPPPHQQQPQAPPVQSAEPPQPQQQRDNLLSPIRIKRQRNNKVQSSTQSPDAESPRNAPRSQVLLKGRHRPDATPAVRADALWTQSIIHYNGGGESASDHDDPYNDLSGRGGGANANNNNINKARTITALIQEDEEEEEEVDVRKNNTSNAAPPSSTSSAAAEPTIRSDALWAQNMMSKDDGHQQQDADSFGVLTPEGLRSPVDPSSAHHQGNAVPPGTPTTTSSIAPVPFLNSDDDDDEDEDDEIEEKDSKMDSTGYGDTTDTFTTDGDTLTTHTTGTAAAATTTTTLNAVPNNTLTRENSQHGRSVDTSLEDGNIVDEDDLDLIPSDEQDDQDEDQKVVPETDNCSSEDFYLKHILSEEDDDDQGGVVSEQDEELILEELSKKSSNAGSPPRDANRHEDSNKSDLVEPSDNEEEPDEYMIPLSSHPDDSKVSTEEFEIEVVHSHSDKSAQAANTSIPPTTRGVVEENLNTTQSSNFTLDDSDLAEVENKERMSIGQRSTLTNMQHRLLAMRTIKDTYKRKLVLQEKESVQLQVRLLASQYEAKEATMALQNAEATLVNEQSKLLASENERKHQKELLQNLQEQLAIVTAQLQKSKEPTPNNHLPPRGDGMGTSFHSSFHSETTFGDNNKVASMEEQLLVQDEEMDQLAAQIQELKSKTAELEAAKGVAEEKLSEALAREESLKAQLSDRRQRMVGDLVLSNGESANNSDSDRQEIQRLKELMQANKERFVSESAGLRKQLEDDQKEHELEIAKLQEQVENNKILAESVQKEAEHSRTELLQELARSKIQHRKAIEELRESLSKAHQEEKSKLHKDYTSALERLEEEIVGSRSELSV